MILRALRDESVKPERCFVIGDSVADVEAARVAGCTGIYVGPAKSGYQTMSITEAAEIAIKAIE